jgi:hypothetical protein
VDWIGLAKDRNRWRAVVNSLLNLRVPWNAGKLSSGLSSSGLSSSAQLYGVSLLRTNVAMKVSTAPRIPSVLQPTFSSWILTLQIILYFSFILLFVIAGIIRIFFI